MKISDFSTFKYKIGIEFDMEMHVLVVFGLIVSIISRFIGAVVSLDIYSKTKDRRHFLQFTGWIFLLIGAVSPFGISLTQDLFIANLFFIIIYVCHNIGLFLLLTGFTMYFIIYRTNIVVSILLTIILTPVLVILLFDVSLAVRISIFYQIFVVLLFITIVYSNRNEIKILLQYSYGLIILLLISLIVYVIVNVYVMIRTFGHDYGLYMSTDIIAIMANYSSTTMLTLLGILIFLHLEQGINVKKKNLLKDDYSHKIGNILQIVVLASSMISALSDSSEIFEMIDLILESSEEAGELVKEIRRM